MAAAVILVLPCGGRDSIRGWYNAKTLIVRSPLLIRRFLPVQRPYVGNLPIISRFSSGKFPVDRGLKAVGSGEGCSGTNRVRTHPITQLRHQPPAAAPSPPSPGVLRITKTHTFGFVNNHPLFVEGSFFGFGWFVARLNLPRWWFLPS